MQGSFHPVQSNVRRGPNDFGYLSYYICVVTLINQSKSIFNSGITS